VESLRKLINTKFIPPFLSRQEDGCTVTNGFCYPKSTQGLRPWTLDDFRVMIRTNGKQHIRTIPQRRSELRKVLLQLRNDMMGRAFSVEDQKVWLEFVVNGDADE